MKRTISLVLLVGLFVFGGDRLEAGGRGHFGTRGSAHIGHQGRAGLGLGVRNYRHCGFGRNSALGFRHLQSSYRSGFYFPGYYAPFYFYDSYAAPMPGADVPLPGYAEDSQPDYIRHPARNEKAKCKDAWTGSRNTDSLGGVMGRVLELQCENGHPSSTSELKNSTDDNTR
jgi:hypothetical protein